MSGRRGHEVTRRRLRAAVAWGVPRVPWGLAVRRMDAWGQTAPVAQRRGTCGGASLWRFALPRLGW
jgi:hypothetical protein